MLGLSRSFRARFFATCTMAGMVLGMAGIAAVGVENVSFGHGHLAGEHSVHHRHLYFGPHEHDADPDHDHDHEVPAREDRTAQRRTSTASIAPTLFQPASSSGLEIHLADAAPLVPALERPLIAQAVVRLAPPRAPPPLLAAPGSLD